MSLPLRAQQSPPPADRQSPSNSLAASLSTSSQPSGTQAVSPPVSISLAEAQQRALKIEPTLLAATTAYRSSKYDRSIARSALLPQAVYHAQYLYTEPNGVPNSGPLPGTIGPVFIANNAVREYTSQAHVMEKLSLANAAIYKQAGALQLRAQAEAEIAARSLRVVVTQAYYAVQSTTQKAQAAQQARMEAQNFVDLTRKLEAGREVAHSDVIKAQLLLAQRQRDLEDARLAAMEARQYLGVLLFPDPATPYVLADPLNGSIDIPDEGVVRTLASQSNPELGSALAALRATDADVLASRAEYVPTLTFGYDYGIDAPYVQTSGAGGRQFLGYAAYGSLDVPMWNWFATHDRVKQSELRQHQARAALSYTQRQLIATLNADYSELLTAKDALLSLNDSVGQARQSLYLTTLRYQSGEATVLEVVDAQNTYLGTEAAAADGAVRYRVARANLERLTGKLP